jgi:protein-tyrosine-phosphatase
MPPSTARPRSRAGRPWDGVVWGQQRLDDAADVAITMGCGDACPIYPGKRYEDWELQDPAGQPVEVVRGIRDDIDARVQQLLTELAPASA